MQYSFPSFMSLLLRRKNNVLIQKLKALSGISQLPAYVEGSKVAMLSSFYRTGGNDDDFIHS